MKVYCKNCKYLLSFMYDYYCSANCFNPYIKKLTKEMNKNGNCKSYKPKPIAIIKKRKWYKFWIKDKK